MLQIKLAITTKRTYLPSNSLKWNRPKIMEIDLNKESSPNINIKTADDFRIIFLNAKLILAN